jgi:hypothetical protein
VSPCVYLFPARAAEDARSAPPPVRSTLRSAAARRTWHPQTCRGHGPGRDPEPEGRPDRDLRVPTTPGGVTAGSTVHGFPLRDARGDTGARSRRDSRRQWAWERAVCVWPAAVGAWASRSVSVYFSVITAHSTHVASAANYLAQRCWANTNSDRECPAFS